MKPNSGKKWVLYRQQKRQCHYCFNQFPIHRLTFDHVIRKRDGGTNRRENLVLACPPCNSMRELPITATWQVRAKLTLRHREYVEQYGL